MKTVFSLCLILLALDVFTQEDNQNLNDVEISYRKYEKFDLGDLEIEGKIIVPSDLSVKEYGSVDFQRQLFEKPHFQQEKLKDLLNL